MLNFSLESFPEVHQTLILEIAKWGLSTHTVWTVLGSSGEIITTKIQLDDRLRLCVWKNSCLPIRAARSIPISHINQAEMDDESIDNENY